MRRHRWSVLVVVGSLVGALLSGCGDDLGVDRDLVDEWTTIGTPTGFTPAARTCHAGDYAASVPRDSYNPVECTARHTTETIFVGAFAASTAAGAAGSSAPPVAGSPDYVKAFAECDRQARTYLGRDYRHGRLWLGVTVPSEAGWRGGARWYRCELGEAVDVENAVEGVKPRTGSLAGALRAVSPMVLTCYQVKPGQNNAIDSMTATPCAKPHNSEFTGVYVTPLAAYPSKATEWEKLHAGCRKVIAKHAALPDDAKLKYRTGTVVVPGPRQDWLAGNRGIRCYLYISDRTFTKSLKGAGTKGLPIRYG